MTRLPLTGGCNCGAVRFEVTAPLVAASYCHCRRCQRRSGTAAAANAHPAPDTFRIVAGHDQLHVWKPENGGEVVLRAMRLVDVRPQSVARRPDRHPHGRLRWRSGRSPERSAVRGLCRLLGAASRRRAPSPSGEPPRDGLTEACPTDRSHLPSISVGGGAGGAIVRSVSDCPTLGSTGRAKRRV